MLQVTHPGVYVQEAPSGSRTLVGVATSIAAFVGRAARGPVNEPIFINSYADYQRAFGGLWADSSMSFAVRDFYQNGGGQAVIVRIINGATKCSTTLGTGAAAPNDTLPIEAASAGTWGRDLKATVDHSTSDPADTELFNLTLEDTASGASETFLNISVDENSVRFAGTVLEQQSSLARLTKSSGSWVVPNVRPLAASTEFPNNVGGDGSAISSTQIVGGTTAADKEGLYALEKTDLFNLLCIPPYTAAGDVDDTVITSAAAYAAQRRAFYIIDSPSSWVDKASAKSNLSSLQTLVGQNDNNSAVYFPRIQQANPLKENQQEIFPACGAIAGIYASTDANVGVWKAPAGLSASLTGVTGLSVPLTDAENGELNPIGINCLRTFANSGNVVWGARTMQGADIKASEWKYLSVRRLALYLQESLYRGMQWAVFEPNDESLWAQIRLSVGAFMQDLYQQGAFFGSSKDAYYVKCDATTTTAYDRDRGIVNIEVGFAAVKPAEFVVITFQQIAGQSGS